MIEFIVFLVVRRRYDVVDVCRLEEIKFEDSDLRKKFGGKVCVN